MLQNPELDEDHDVANAARLLQDTWLLNPKLDGFLEHLRATKTPKPHLNRLEKSVKTLLEDPKCVAQVRLH